MNVEHLVDSIARPKLIQTASIALCGCSCSSFDAKVEGYGSTLGSASSNIGTVPILDQ
jgi:hypothetical protein